MRLEKNFTAWFRLLRLPNLLTAPGDPVAGYLFATTAAGGSFDDTNPFLFPVLCIPSIFLYAAGTVHNDICDVEEDRVKRPERPIPSGQIGFATAGVVTVVLFTAGIAVVACISAWKNTGFVPSLAALALATCIFLYNSRLKKNRFAGPVSMGMCRGLNFLLGASFVQAVTAGLVATAAGILLYVAAVTFLADEEDTGGVSMAGKFLPAGALLFWCSGILVDYRLASMMNQPTSWLAIICYMLAFLSAVVVAIRLKQDSEKMEIAGCVSILIRNIILLQASICFFVSGAAILASGLLFFWLVHVILSKYFSPT